MLQLKNIVKDYLAGENIVHALKDVSITFRSNEFVSILGQSGCGKTTLLNIIGGLDRYTDGDLIIDGVSTKFFKDKDWDTYRNQEIGFVFQSYNLIPHQTVLGNVELALTIGGVSKKERKERAIEALKKVGLENQINKRPNQLSGGQMQRVAIARALVNDPNIILADEPTGALDSETSVQVMELLKEIAKDRLVIMVTHNNELADKYSTRIIKLFDGKIIDDSKPVDSAEVSEEVSSRLSDNKAKMSFATALTLSFKNLLTKKGRTFMTSFAGSIGIIGIALVLSVSNGFTNYINDMQSNMLGGYPITISQFAADYEAIAAAANKGGETYESFPSDDELRVYQQDTGTIAQLGQLNKITSKYVNYVDKYYQADLEKKEKDRTISSIQYSYAQSMHFMAKDGEQYSFCKMSPKGYGAVEISSILMGTTTSYFQEALDNKEFVNSTYDVIYGSYPSAYNEVALVVDSKNRIDISTLQMIGIDINHGTESQVKTIDFASLVYQNESNKGLEYRCIFNDAYYSEVTDVSGKYYKPASDMAEYSTSAARKEYYNSLANGDYVDLKVVGVLRINENASYGFLNTGVLYHPDLTTIFRTDAKNSKIYEDNSPTTGGFLLGEYKDMLDSYDSLFKAYKIRETNAGVGGNDYKISYNILNMLFTMADQTITPSYIKMISEQCIGASDIPSAIFIYPKGFNEKKEITKYLDEWNKDEANVNDKIIYTDAASTLTTSIGAMINIVKYVLVAFAAISLIVSSIMIGIITYVSVIERTKEIGVLRSLGARKKDIAAVFNAETLIIGLVAGLLGIGVSIILNIPINAIILSLAGETINGNLAVLAFTDAISLVVISVLLTCISGLVPASIASKKDPVIALRTE